MVLTQNQLFIRKFYPLIVDRITRRTGLSPEVVLAQIARETRVNGVIGASMLAKDHNNLFGITYKAGNLGTADPVRHRNRLFCAYKQVEDCLDHYTTKMLNPPYLIPSNMATASWEKQCVWIGRSPWSEHKYAKPGEEPGTNLIKDLKVILKNLPWSE